MYNRGVEQPAVQIDTVEMDHKDASRLTQPAQHGDAGWSSPVARQAHNLKVVGSNPTPATTAMANTDAMSHSGPVACAIGTSRKSRCRAPQLRQSTDLLLGCRSADDRAALMFDSDAYFYSLPTVSTGPIAC
jgi:hypothetical protein